ncbi:MAG TPA: hypothetical protein VN372_05270 [Methanospirillum sp.]|nr:hypothetical protein [Methanospirillum sp.]
MGRDVTSISGIDDLLLLARVKFGREFNLSKFVRDCLETALFEDEIIQDPRTEAAKRAAEKILKERASQKKLIEESRNYELIVLEMKKKDDEKFLQLVKQVFREDPARYINQLPECSPTGNDRFWKQKAEILTELCGFPVSSEQIMSYIRESI